MAGSVTWEWRHFWGWWSTLSSEKKSEALDLIRIQEFNSLPPEEQAEIFRPAPEEVLLNLKHMPMVHRETILILQEERDERDRKMFAVMKKYKMQERRNR